MVTDLSALLYFRSRSRLIAPLTTLPTGSRYQNTYIQYLFYGDIGGDQPFSEGSASPEMESLLLRLFAGMGGSSQAEER